MPKRKVSADPVPYPADRYLNSIVEWSLRKARRALAKKAVQVSSTGSK